LIDLFQAHYNHYTRLLPEGQLREIRVQGFSETDECSLLLHCAVMAIGLLHADNSRQDATALISFAGARSVLHTALKESVEMGHLFGQSIQQLPILLLLSELEHSNGRLGTAVLYLKEALDIASQPELGHVDLSTPDDEILRQRCHMRACDFIRMQCKLFGGPQWRGNARVSLQRKVEQTRPQIYHSNDLERSANLAHLDLLRTVDSALQISGLQFARQVLDRWYSALPHEMRWEHCNQEWPASLFLLHQQYFALSTSLYGRAYDQQNDPHIVLFLHVDRDTQVAQRWHESAVQLSQVLVEYCMRYPAQHAPLITAYHIELAANSLARSASSLPATDETRNRSLLHGLRETMTAMSNTYARLSPAKEIFGHAMNDDMSAAGSLTQINRDDAQLLPRDGTLPNWEDLSSFDHDPYSETHRMTSVQETEVPISSERHASNPSLHETIETSHTASEAYSIRPRKFSSKGISCTSSRDNDEERLMLFSDPVFCAYVDEVSYIVGQSTSPRDEDGHQGTGSDSGRKSRTSPLKDSIEELRAHLGHDVSPVNAATAPAVEMMHNFGDVADRGIAFSNFLSPMIAES
jgi:hypothetical protein